MAQLSNPTHRDWVSQVLQELEELEIQLEIEEIEVMSKVQYKSLIKEAVYNRAFSDLLRRKEGRNSDNAKGKMIKYTEFKEAEYLSPENEYLTIKEKKWMFKCRVEDIEIKGNHRWKYSNISCFSCKKNIDETQGHLASCEYLLGKNEHMSYIPEYDELYNGSLNEQIYMSRILQENYKRRLVEE